MRAKKSKHVAEITSPTKGVATYRTATGGMVFHAHWSADPLKTEEWADMVASDEPGGRQSVTYLQEFEADDDAKSGERIYWAFDRERNVVRREDVFPLGIPKDWPVSLGADFGQKAPTAIIFFVQDPKSRRVYVFDSIYRPRGIDVAVKLEVYEKIGRHYDVPLDKLALDGLHRYIDAAIPDPTAAPYIDYYAEEPWPVFFTLGKNEAVKGSRKRGPAESLVNKLLWPSFVCCEKLTFPSRGTDDEPDEPPETAPCPLCGKENRLLPMLFVLEGASEELCNQWEDLVDVDARFEGFDSPEKSTGLPDHAADGAKYRLVDMDIDPEHALTEKAQSALGLRRLREKAPYERTTEDLIALHFAKVADRMQRERDFLDGKGQGRRIMASRWGFGRKVTYSTPERTPRAQA